MSLAFARRIDFDNNEPQLLELDFAAPQKSWVTFLKTQEHLLPGISGSAKNLLATLYFSISSLAKKHPEAISLKDVFPGVRELAKYIIRRATSERSHALKLSLNERDEKLKLRILKHLEATPQLERNIYRSLTISATDCQRLLLDLQSEKLVQRDDTPGYWSFANQPTPHPTLEVS